MVSKRSRARDYDEIKTAEDILYRWSRPQRNSTFVPNQRDWRYETGVYQHQDFDNSKGDKTIWDMLDEDNENGVFGRERRRKKGGKANSKMNNGETEGYGREEAGAVELGISTGSVTPARSHIDTVTPASTWKNKETASPPNKSNTFRTLSPKLYGRAADYTESNGEEEWEQTGFLVRLHFPRKKSSLSAILNRFPPQCALSSEPNTPVTPSKLFTPADSHDRGKIDSLRLFHREWRDKTLNFCMRNVLGLLHHPEKLADSIPASFQWWDGAVPVDAILPPGIAMSAKELNAYYPHHIRWKSVAMRLFNNSYSYSDIMKIQCFFRSSPEFPVDGNSFRDFFRQAIRGNDPTFKVTDLEPKADLNLYTEGFYSTQFIESRGYTVPTFDDLLKGLKFLPTGLDARELTQCLVWYLNSADLFTPRLELNVLHVQSLVRALKLPLKDYGFRNLDIIGLNEFHEHDGYPNSRQADNERIVCNKETETDESRVKKKGYGVKDAQLGVEKGKHITLHIDSSNGTITTTVPISVRSIFQLPFMSMYGMVAVALRMGIENALTKKALRERSENGQNVEKPENDMNERPVQDFVSAHVEEKARLNLMSLIGAYKRTREDDGKDHGQQEGRPPKKVAIQPRCG